VIANPFFLVAPKEIHSLQVRVSFVPFFQLVRGHVLRNADFGSFRERRQRIAVKPQKEPFDNFGNERLDEYERNRVYCTWQHSRPQRRNSSHFYCGGQCCLKRRGLHSHNHRGRQCLSLRRQQFIFHVVIR